MAFLLRRGSCRGRIGSNEVKEPIRQRNAKRRSCYKRGEKGQISVYTTLRLLGILCIVALGGSIVLALMGEGGFWAPVPSLAFVGILFLALARILEHLETVEYLLRSSATAGADRIQTALGSFEKLGKVKGQATCVGCRRTVPKAGLYYNEELDAYYHGACLSRDNRNP
jgi:hypothetical protein